MYMRTECVLKRVVYNAQLDRHQLSACRIIHKIQPPPPLSVALSSPSCLPYTLAPPSSRSLVFLHLFSLTLSLAPPRSLSRLHSLSLLRARACTRALSLAHTLTHNCCVLSLARSLSLSRWQSWMQAHNMENSSTDGSASCTLSPVQFLKSQPGTQFPESNVNTADS